jgi:hypothetical protein
MRVVEGRDGTGGGRPGTAGTEAALWVTEHLVLEPADGEAVPLGEIIRFGPILRCFRVVANGRLPGDLRVQNQQSGEWYHLHTDLVALANLDQLRPANLLRLG